MAEFSFELDFEQSLMQSTLEKALNKTYSLEELRKSVTQPGIHEGVKEFLQEQGILGMLNPIESGESYLMFSSLLNIQGGKRLVAFPILEQLMGIYVLKQLGQFNNEVEQYESAEKIVTVGWNTKNIKLNNNKICGTIENIPFAEDAQQIVAPFDQNRLMVIRKESVEHLIQPVKVHDLTYPQFKISFEDMAIGEDIKIFDIDLDNFNRVTQLFIASQLYGIAQECFEMSLEYAKERKQFGTEIGRFQAVKHMLADMYVMCESAKTVVEYGSWAIETNGEDHEIVGSIAKAYTSDAALQVVHQAIQLHGAIGFTWEHDLHFYLKRAYRLSKMYLTEYQEKDGIMDFIINNNPKCQKVKEESI